MAFKIYTTDSLKGILKGFGGEIKIRYYDLITEKKIKEESRSADEIVEGIRNKLKGFSEV